MKQKRQKKQAITLLEIMVVIFLIGLIGSVIGFNVKGSLDEGKAFKTEQAISQIEDILLLALADGADIEDMKSNVTNYLTSSGLCKNADKLMKDGWGNPLTISIVDRQTVTVSSLALQSYKDKRTARHSSTQASN